MIFRAKNRRGKQPGKYCLMGDAMSGHQENGWIEASVEELAGLIVQAEPGNMRLLADMHGRMEKIEEWATSERLDAVACAVKATAKLIEEIILEEVVDGQAALDVAGRTISGLQAIVLAGRSPDEVKFPAELLGKTEGKSEETIKEENTESKQASIAEPAAVAKAELIGSSAFPAPISIEGDPALLAEFISEAREHLESADVHLLTLETDPSNEESIHSVFRAFHTIKGVAGLLGLAEIGKLAHEAENLLDRVRKHEVAISGRVVDAIFETTDMLKRQINALKEMLSSGTPAESDPGLPALLETIRRTARGDAAESGYTETGIEPRRKLGEILVEQGSVSAEDVNAALKRQSTDPDHPKLGSVLVEEGKVAPKEIVNALRAQNSVQIKETVKVDADRLDRLVDTIGELVIAESMVSQSSKSGQMGAIFLRHLNELDKITRELQQMGTSLRMVPLRATFQKMARLVRDLAKKAGKQVDFVMAGEDTELDKTVVDRIGDPLVHMVRNAVDHGLEASGQDRLRAGKSESGRVELRAFHKGGNIYIEIEDDGRGLDREAILTKGRERGLIAEGETPSDRDIYNMIFQPGFSTAKQITDVSGRGVGMDVVKRNIDSLRGQVEIRTEVGKGSTFSIRLPLTLAIIDGMVVRVGAERYIIPTLSVLISMRPEPSQLSSVLGSGQMLSHQGRELPLFRLDEIFKVNGAEKDPTRALAVVVEDDGRQIAMLVDELLGQQQIVIKSLGESVRGIPGISGGAIMPDGRVGLILDVGGVIRLAQTGR